MNRVLRLSTLSPGRRRLVELMQSVQFGRIENLLIQSGEPVFTPPPKLVREIRLRGGEGEVAGETAGAPDFALKTQVVDLLDQLTDLGNGRVDLIVVKHGLPFSLSIEQQPA